MSFANPVSANDELNSPLNPFYTSEVGIPEVVTNVHSYNPASVAGNGTTSNHDYTVVGTTFRLKQVLLSSASKFEAEIQVGPVGTLVTKARIRVNTQAMTEPAIFDPPIPVPNGQIVRVIRRRFQTGTDTVDTTIMGEDVA